MKPVAPKSETCLSRLRPWWAAHRTALLRLAIVILAVLAVLKLGDEFRRLLWDSGRLGAVDLKLRYQEVQAWFAGKPLDRAGYPPASQVILWPFLGWLSLPQARWLWAITSVTALGWLSYLTIRESGASGAQERAVAALIPLSMNATGVTIGNGQLLVHLLPALVAGLILLYRGHSQGHRKLLAIVLLLASLVKPNASVPFFWLVLFAPGKLGLALLVGAGYVALTEAGLVQLLSHWSTSAADGTTRWAVTLGYGSLHGWLHALGLERWNLLASLVVLLALGGWTYRHRHDDLWLLLGVTALVARF